VDVSRSFLAHHGIRTGPCETRPRGFLVSADYEGVTNAFFVDADSAGLSGGWRVCTRYSAGKEGEEFGERVATRSALQKSAEGLEYTGVISLYFLRESERAKQEREPKAAPWSP
jgi:hypothetical protein